MVNHFSNLNRNLTNLINLRLTVFLLSAAEYKRCTEIVTILITVKKKTALTNHRRLKFSL